MLRTKNPHTICSARGKGKERERQKDRDRETHRQTERQIETERRRKGWMEGGREPTLVAGSINSTPFLFRPMSNTSGYFGSVVCCTNNTHTVSETELTQKHFLSSQPGDQGPSWAYPDFKESRSKGWPATDILQEANLGFLLRPSMVPAEICHHSLEQHSSIATS